MSRKGTFVQPLVATVVLLALVAACAPAPTPVVVEKEKVVEKPVVQTVVVEKEKVVEKPVVQTVVVEKEKEVMVTPTPKPLPAGAVKIVPFLTTESDPDSVDLFQQIVAEYEKTHPDVQVDMVLVGHGVEDARIVTAMAVGADLGIIQVEPRSVPDFVEAGYLLPLDDVVKAIGEKDFKPNSRIILNGHTWAIGYAGGTHGTLWVRKDLFEKAGLEFPKTYDELLAAAKALTQDTDGDGKIDIYGIGLPAGPDGATTARFVNFVYQNCGDYFDKEGNLVFDQPQVLEAVKRYVALLEYSPPGYTGWSWFDGLNAFMAGKVAMHPYGGRLGVNVYKADPELRDKSTVIVFPAGDKVRAGRGTYDYLAIASTAKFPDAAKDFMAFYLTGDRLARFLLTVPGHLMPPLYSVAELITTMDNEYVKRYPEDVKTLFASQDTNAEPTINMGAVDTKTCTFSPTLNPMPWAGCIFSRRPPIDAEMIQRIVINKESPEDAWKWAYTEMKKCADEWKAQHPGWKPPK